MPPVSQKMLFIGQRVPTIAAIPFHRGLLDCRTITNTVTGEQFEYFVQHDLSSHLHAFDGTAPRSIVILDNASVQHAGGIVDKYRAQDLWFTFYPPTVQT